MDYPKLECRISSGLISKWFPLNRFDGPACKNDNFRHLPNVGSIGWLIEAITSIIKLNTTLRPITNTYLQSGEKRQKRTSNN